MDIPGLLAGIDRAKQAVKSNFGLLMDNPQEYFRLIGESARDINRQDRLAVQGDRAQMAGRQATPEQLAAMAASRQRAEDLAMGFAGTFGGVGAKTADLVQLDLAKKLQAAGESAKDIWAKTGWFKGVDDKWRFEINDRTVPLKKELTEQTLLSYPKIADVLPHEDLLKAYPSLSRLRVAPEYAQGIGGRFDATQGVITVRPRESGANPMQAGKEEKSILLHELQHAIQNQEGFAQGGSPAMFRRPDGKKLADQMVSRLEGQIDEAVRVGDKKLYDKLSRARASLLNEEGAYRSLAGEAEARAVQAREGLVDAGRRKFFPYESYDVPVESLIVSGDRGAAMSIAPVKGQPAGLLQAPKTQYELAHEAAQKNAVEMLGLPPNNTAMDRARALGFDTPAYHGTDKDFYAFDKAMRGSATDEGWYGPGEYSSPFPHGAEAYAMSNWPNYKDGANVMPLMLKNPEAVKNKFGNVTEYVTREPNQIRSRFAAFDPKRINEPDLLAAGVPLGLIAGSDIDLPKPEERKKKK